MPFVFETDLSHIDTWIFDLDNTLYPPEAEVMALVEGKMTAFVMRQTGLDRDEAYAMQRRYLSEHGTTLAGLVAHHGIDPYTFLHEVHDVSLDKLTRDDDLIAGLKSLPGRRLVFTNGDERHATRILKAMEIDDLFEDVFHLEAANWLPKPHPDTFARLIDKHKITPESAIFFEDTARNLKPAAQLGMKTALVGPRAVDNDDDFVDFKAPSLKYFLSQLIF